MNISSPGDTILIGPGRYDETRPYYLIDSWTAETCVGVEIEDITLLGEDRFSVFIGPPTPDFNGGGPYGIVSQIGIQNFHIENIAVENVYLGAVVFGAVEIVNFRSSGCNNAIYGFTENGLIASNCHFSDCHTGIKTYSPSQDVVVRDCAFSNNWAGITLVSSDNVLVADCTFSGVGSGGINFQGGTSGRVENCVISEKPNYNVSTIDSQMEIYDNFFGICGYGAIFQWASSIVSGTRNIFEGGELSTIRLEEGADVALNGNHIFFNTGHSIWIRGGTGYEGGPDVFLDFQENYWGTTDVDSIAASIFDGNDEPAYTAFVDFLPIADGPVPAENKPFGSIKALFR